MSGVGDRLWDVIVVGAGVVGSATTYQLAKQGFKTLLIEQFSLGHSRGSSCGRSRIIRRAYDQDHYADMMPESFRFWTELEKEADTKLMKQVGLLMVAGADAPDMDEYLAVMTRQGAEFQLIRSDEELRARYPMFRFPPDSRALLDPAGACMYVSKCVKALQDMSRKHGATILENTSVENIYPKMVTEVATSDGRYRTRYLVLCPGPWAQSLLNKVGLQIPVQIYPGFQCYWRVKSPGMFSPDKTPIMVHEDGPMFKYSFPDHEYPGLVKVGTRGQLLTEPVDPDASSTSQRNRENRERVVRHLSEYVRRVLPHLEDQPALIEPCLYTFTPDLEYIVDRHPKYKTIFVAAGMSGHGFKTAPMVGKMITEMIQGKPTSYDASHYSLQRFKHRKPTSNL